MYLLYLDDSGSVGNKDEEHFVLGGVCVWEHRLKDLSQNIRAVAESISSIAPGSIELHASEIWAGRKDPWKSMGRTTRKDVIKQTLETMRGEPATTVVFACAIHKDSFPKQDPVELAFEELCSRFDLFLARQRIKFNQHHQGLIVLDEATYETALQGLSRKFRFLGTRWGKSIKYLNEVPLFVDSKASRLIQLADHVAYAVRRRYDADDLTYFNCIESRFDSEEGKIHGLVHKQHKNACCTCPCCFQRRI